MDQSFFLAQIFTGVPLANFIIGICLIILILLIAREVTTWYWKINEIIELLGEIRENTEKETSKEEIK
jgi:hypothetical protein